MINRINRDVTVTAVLTVAMMLLFGALTASTARADSAGPYQIRFEPSGKCVDNFRGRAVNDNKIQQWTCARPGEPNFNNQRWYFDWASDGSGYAQIRNVGTGMCLDVQSSSGANGAAIVLWNCAGAVWWYGTFQHGGTVDWYQLHPTYLDLCLDLPRSSTADGVQLQQWQCVSSNASQHLTWS